MRLPEPGVVSAMADTARVVDSSRMDSASEVGNAVRQHYLFAGLSEDDFATLAAEASVKHIDRGTALFHRGDPSSCFYFLDTGLVELSLVSPTGEKKTLEVVGPGRTFAEAVAFMQEHRFPVTAEALEPSRLCRIPADVYVELIRSNPDACMRLLADISRHLHARVREIEHLTIQNARSRLISYLLDHIAERNDDEATVRLSLPRHVVASRLSITPETLSRLIRSLTDEGLISVEDRIVFIHRLADLKLYY